jgi:hypothetical protein
MAFWDDLRRRLLSIPRVLGRTWMGSLCMELVFVGFGYHKPYF